MHLAVAGTPHFLMLSYYEDRYRQRVLSNLQRRAKSMGFVLQQVEPAGAQAGVS